MAVWVARYGLGFVLVCLASFWLYFFFYNVGICSLRTLWLKPLLKTFNKAVFVFFVPVGLLLWRHTDFVREVVGLEPVSPAAWTAVLFVVGVWLFALPNQALVSWRLFRRRPPRALVRWKTSLRGMIPESSDWDVCLRAGYGIQPRAGTGSPPVPRYRRRVGRLYVRHYRAHPLHKRWMNWLNGAYRLRVHRICLAFDTLPEAFDGVRILHLTDFHFSEMLSPRYFAHVIGCAGELRPDVIVLTGDFSGGNHLYRESIEIYRSLEAPLGKFAVRGNHDYSSEPEVIAYWLEREGVTLLENRPVDIRRGDSVLRLIGVEHPYERLDADGWASLLGGRTDGVFRVVLSHTPDNIGRIARHGCELVLSGHTHGGQGRLPLIGPMFVPSRHGRRFHEGLHEVGSSLLYVNAGVGLHTVPLRFRCRPEIALLELCRV